WLHGSTLEYFRLRQNNPAARLASAFKATLKRLAPMALGLILLAAVILAIMGLGSRYSREITNWIASALTLQLRRPVAPALIFTLFNWLVAFVAWVVLPLVLLPLGRELAGFGFSGLSGQKLRNAWRTTRTLRFWLSYIGLF